MSEEIKVMSIAEIRERIGEPKVVKLPSGIAVKIRRLTPMDYLKEGVTEIPNEFAQFLVELHNGTLDLKDDKNKVRRNWELFEKFSKVTVEKGVIEPPMVYRYEADKQDTHLLYWELSTADQNYLLQAIRGII